MCVRTYICISVPHVYSAHRGQNMALDHLKLGGKMPCGCSELNPGPLEEQPVILLISESSLQPSIDYKILKSQDLAYFLPWVQLKEGYRPRTTSSSGFISSRPLSSPV